MPLIYPLHRLSQDGSQSRVRSHAHITRPGITNTCHHAHICAVRVNSMCNGPHTPSLLEPLCAGSTV